jgi:hypothetical protein
MSLFKTDPLLAFCRLLAWIMLGLAIATLAATGCAGLAGLLAPDMLLTGLRRTYPALRNEGLLPLFALLMLFVACAMALGVRFLLHLLAITRSVRAGEAFTLANAARIRAMAWISLAAMPLGFFIEPLGTQVGALLGPAADEGRFRIMSPGELNFGHILLTLLLFVLARLFAQAAAMRDEIEGTV